MLLQKKMNTETIQALMDVRIPIDCIRDFMDGVNELFELEMKLLGYTISENNFVITEINKIIKRTEETVSLITKGHIQDMEQIVNEVNNITTDLDDQQLQVFSILLYVTLNACDPSSIQM